jgi:O-antigen/teichoic acid export membrane protein
VEGHRLDIFWAYVVSSARVASWIAVYGTLYRRVGAEAAALLALVRWTLGLLNYASAGLAPAILHYAAKAKPADHPPALSPDNSALSTQHFSLRSVYISGVSLSWIGATIGAIALWAWVLTQGRARGVATLVGLFGTGMLIDMAADAWGAIIQSRGRIRTDYQCQTTLETFWALLAVFGTLHRDQLGLSWQGIVGGSFCVAAILSAGLRALIARPLIPKLKTDSPTTSMARRLLAFGGFVVLAQIAEYLYAPTDFLLIRWLIDLKTVAVYAPAVQMDAGIWLLFGSLSTVLLPMSVKEFGKGNFKELRRYYLQGTAISFLMLLAASILAWFASPGIFKLWLGDKMRPTQHILPLVFISTVIGGSAAVGRSILLATGKVRAFTISVLLAGVTNVILSYCFVRFGGMGLTGIILGTIVAVVARCAIWMPWYVLRSLRRLSEAPGRGFDVVFPLETE